MGTDFDTNTLLLLIDFEGHPILGDEYTNNLRYSYLLKILEITDTRLLILSNHDMHDKKTSEIEHIAKSEGVHTWLNIHHTKPYSVKDLINIAAEKNNNIKNIIVGGTNTAGCVLRTKPYSATAFAKAGYKVQIFLPLCAEYQMVGVNAVEKNMKSYAVIYNHIREQRLVDSIDIVTEFGDLHL
jgi:hypothetical protein